MSAPSPRSPYALVELIGPNDAIVRRKYKTREAMNRWAAHHGLRPAIVTDVTRVGERIRLCNPKKWRHVAAPGGGS